MDPYVLKIVAIVAGSWFVICGILTFCVYRIGKSLKEDDRG